jgi:hypothetical protein
MVDCQIVCVTAVDTSIPIPVHNLLSPHSLGIAAAECEEIVHQGSGCLHDEETWLLFS